MLRRLDLTDRTGAGGPAELRRVLPRARVDVSAAVATVAPLVSEVKERGYPAVREATLRFDGVDVEQPRVPAAALAEALAALDPAVRSALEESIRRARIVHEAQRREPSTCPSCRAAASPNAGSRSSGSASTSPAGWPSTRPASS